MIRNSIDSLSFRGVDTLSEQAPVRQREVPRAFLKDTVAIQTAVAVNGSVVGSRPSLEAPSKVQNPDCLTALSKAFAEAFDAMSNGLMTATSDYAQTQQLNQTDSNIVLQLSTKAINKAQAAEVLAAKIQAEVGDGEKADSILGWVFRIFGGVLMAGTFIAGLVTGGAADAALPEEAALVEGGASAIEGGSSSLIAEQAGDVEMTNIANETEAPAEEQKPQLTFKERGTQILKKMVLNKKWLQFAGSTVFAIPTIAKAAYDLKLAPQYAELSELQAKVGHSFATMETNEMFFKFLQQLLQKQSDVTQQEMTGTTKVFAADSNVMEGWRLIANNLASAA